jgi:DNA-binding GntR family transcriptional regulator
MQVPIAEAYLARTPASEATMRRAERAMPGGSTRTVGWFPPYPVVFDHGNGPFLYDLDGHDYVDLFGNGLSLIHGHCYPPIRQAAEAVIARGTAWSGASVPQIEFAEVLRDRIPVREALRHLASEGLVTLAPDVGARVARLNPGELIEVYLMREALEPIAVAQSVPLINEDIIAEMRSLNEEGEERAAAGDMTGFLDLDRRFHELTFSGAELPRLRRVIDSLADTTTQYRRVYSLLPDRLAISHAEHRLLIDAFERRAPDDAAAVHRLHTSRTRDGLTHRPEIFADPDPDATKGEHRSR